MPKNATSYQGHRSYTWKGEKLPSVTTILQSYPKPWLGAWAAKMVAEEAILGMGEWTAMDEDGAIRFLKGSPWRKRDTAADFGTAVHEALAALVRGDTLPSYPGTEGHIAAVKEWWHAYRPHVLDSEVQVFAPEAGYAGSLDLIADVYGRRLVLDLKTGTTLGHDVRLQLAAYRFAEFIGEDDKRIAAMPEVDGCAILHIPRDNPSEWKFVDVPAGAAEYDLFRQLIPLHRFVKDNDRQDVGTLVLPQVEVSHA